MAGGEAPGPAVTYVGAQPSVAGDTSATSTLDHFASALPAGCQPHTQRDDAHVVSIVWNCAGKVAAQTVGLGSGQALTLAQILKGNYVNYLSSVAQTQFKVEGLTGAQTTDLGTWYATADALAVAFPAGIITYPLVSLQPYLVLPSPL